jgi:hypothetical protein
VNISGEVEIEILHRNDLAVSTSRRSAFDSERRTLAGLTNAREYLLAEMRSKRLTEPHRGGALAFAERRGRDGGYDNVIAVRRILQSIGDRQVHLGLGSAVHFELIGKDARLGSDFVDRDGRRSLRDFKIGRQQPR